MRIDVLQLENSKLRTKLKEIDDQIVDLHGQIPAQGKLAIAKFKRIG